MSRAGDVERRPRGRAARAAPAAEVRDVECGVLEVGAAAAAHAGVGRVRQTIEEVAALVHPERDAAGRDIPRDLGQGRVVGIDDDGRCGGQAGQGGRPLAGDRVQLAVAVELVPEKVVEQDHPGLEPVDDRAEGRLVRLDDADVADRLAAPGGLLGEGRRHAPDQVGSGAVVDYTGAVGLEHVGNHPGRRGLAVGAGDDDHAAIQTPADLAQDVGIDEIGDQPGRCCPTAASGPAEAGGRQLGRRGGQPEAHVNRLVQCVTAPGPSR